MRNRHNENTDGPMEEGSRRGRGRHGGGNPHKRHGGHHRLGRFFETGDLRLVALQLISEKPRHGYEIIKAIEEKSGGAYTPSAGAVYPTLTLLQELGQLSVTDGEDGRKLHTITEEGTASLLANRKTIDAVFARIAKAEANKERTPAIEEALHRLKHALRRRMSDGDLGEAWIASVVEKINEASSAAEKN